MTNEDYMREALKEAKKASNEVPVGAVIVYQGKIIAVAHNERETAGPFAHAEILAMNRAFQVLGTRRLHGCSLYVTLEPCPLCSGAIIMAQIDACYFGAWDEQQGCCGSVYSLPEDACFSHNARCFGGILETECSTMLKTFFSNRRS